MDFTTKSYTTKISSLHNILREKQDFYKRKKNPMPLMRFKTHLEKVKTNPSNYYIPNKKQS